METASVCSVESVNTIIVLWSSQKGQECQFLGNSSMWTLVQHVFDMNYPNMTKFCFYAHEDTLPHMCEFSEAFCIFHALPVPQLQALPKIEGTCLKG